MKKTPLHLISAGAGLALLGCSAGTDLYVSTPQGDPLDGVILEPVALTYGCTGQVYTGPCGGADLPPCMKRQRLVNLKRAGFEPVYRVDVKQPKPIHVIMRQSCR